MEILVRNAQKAALVARKFCLKHPGSAPDQYIRLAFAPELLKTLLDTPVIELPRTGLPGLSITRRSNE